MEEEEEEVAYSLSVPAILITIFALFVSLHFITSLFTRKLGGNRAKNAGRIQKTAPKAGGSWPLLGHLHILGGLVPRHLVLAKMADIYGPIFTIWLGVRRAVVVSTWDIAKECLTTNERAFATRPRLVCSEVMTYNYAMIGLSPYGPYWRQVRKIATLELLSNHRIELLKHIRESEVLSSVRDIYENYH
ncbi:hypothetical protein CDL15_Pgr006804 [Punica granatum]|uniref:Uncharacterized protein n=1 Tax=Punica granatum TaxID=22663 RepID=A0A218X741_PUNGR|nr:hypothetical protein CDL15_Pgr006804 [Punica granatum]